MVDSAEVAKWAVSAIEWIKGLFACSIPLDGEAIPCVGIGDEV